MSRLIGVLPDNLRRSTFAGAGGSGSAFLMRVVQVQGLTHRARRGDPLIQIKRAAGHRSFNTTEIYLRVAQDFSGGKIGQPFGPLPNSIVYPIVYPRSEKFQPAEFMREKSRNFATPAGIEPALPA